MNDNNTRPAIRSVFLECRTWVDSMSNPYTSAHVWINGRCVGSFSRRYGRAEDVATYDLEPYLERVGILPATPAGQYSPHVRNRLTAVGVDYYEATALRSRRQLATEEELEDADTLTATLIRREQECEAMARP